MLYRHTEFKYFFMLDKALTAAPAAIELMKLLVFIALNVYYRMLLYQPFYSR